RIHREALELLQRWKYTPAPPPPPEHEPHRAAEHRKIPRCIRKGQRQLDQLQELTVPRWVNGFRLPGLFLLLGVLSVGPLLFLGVPWYFAAPGCLLAAVVTFVLARLLLAAAARSQIEQTYQPLAQAVRDAEASRRKVLGHYETKRQKKMAEFKRRHDHSLRKAFRRYKQQRADVRQRRTRELQEAQQRYRQRKAANHQLLVEELRQADESAKRRLAEIQERFDLRSEQVHERRTQKLAELNARYDQTVTSLTTGWEQTLAQAREKAAEIFRTGRELFPDWTSLSWADWPPPSQPPTCLRLGDFRVHLAGSDDPADVIDFRLPALVPFPEHGSLLLEATSPGRPAAEEQSEAVDGRTRAVQALQAVMYRLLTALPPGKVRFTILDPVGLGENFAAFMHLADHDEALVGSRIWTEQVHIEQRLADLTAHMENVIQKYLRNQYRSINEYNAHAGEVAEPFRFLVVANFPSGFTPEAARRLVSVAQAGARCGVFTLVSVDGKLPMPQGFDLADLERASVVLRWQGPRFAWEDPDFGRHPLTLDVPPADEVGLRLLDTVGARAKEASKVEVPFEFIAPPPEQWWAGDSRGGIAVPLGRAGATKRQSLNLGKGTSQHVLVAGKTGSGKSTLLHALITNLALMYSPEEVELYLIDFKKGVEFKTYAAHVLPHARVVAIESEREFGLSVLQRLDQELRDRGELFRAAGVQDIAGYRSSNPSNGRLPRILLIVDEFQEFFVEDDRLSQDAAQLLDRLVRQGRAFGLHILLGSQTLGGAYTLARSTIDQMAVRIALQCSEADAHLILSDDNSAARLLSRPG
ncbi:MAG TPA: FtsK/SpoIIIE domain-containing protein, partial [Gemmataceae bacterium]|nr:FtsK/SpoIIIE domain-containing protein [Gemmataceae bacterium]